LFIGLCLLSVQVWATEDKGKRESKKAPPLMDDASFENKYKESWSCSKELLIDGYEIKATGGGDSGNSFQVITALCGKGGEYDSIYDPRLEIRIYKKGTLITKFSKQYPVGYKGNTQTNKQTNFESKPERGGLMANMFATSTSSSSSSSNSVVRSISRAVGKFKDVVPENIILNAISIEFLGDAENSFIIYFKRSFYESTVLEKKVVSKTDCFQVKIFVLQKDPKEANLLGSVLDSFVRPKNGRGADSSSGYMMRYVESLPKPAESNKCPAGDVSTTSTDDSKDSEPEPEPEHKQESEP